jgi:hypothetical protein
MELEEKDTQLIMASGKTVAPVGMLRYLPIQVGGSRKIEVDAVCLDVEDYGFIVGRIAFHSLGLDTNWKDHNWRVLDEQGENVELEVSYKHDRLTGDFSTPTQESDDEVDDENSEYSNDTASSFLVAFAGLANPEEKNGSDDTRLGTLIHRIRSNPMVKELDIVNELVECITRHSDCFGTDYEHLKQTGVTELHIETGDHPPIYRRPYGSISHDETEFLKQEITSMVNNGIIIPTTYLPANSKYAGWSFPCRLNAKKTGDKRLVTNFMDLNKITVRDTWPLPIMVESLEHLGGSSFFPSMDLLKGFSSNCCKSSLYQQAYYRHAFWELLLCRDALWYTKWTFHLL